MSNKQKTPLWAKILIGLSILFYIGVFSEVIKDEEKKQEEQRIEKKESSKEFTSQKDAIEETLDTEKNEQNIEKLDEEKEKIIGNIKEIESLWEEAGIILEKKAEKDGLYNYTVQTNNTYFSGSYTTDNQGGVILATTAMKPTAIKEIDSLSILQMSIFLKSLDSNLDVKKWFGDITSAVEKGSNQFPIFETDKVTLNTLNLGGNITVAVLPK